MLKEESKRYERVAELIVACVLLFTIAVVVVERSLCSFEFGMKENDANDWKWITVRNEMCPMVVDDGSSWLCGEQAVSGSEQEAENVIERRGGKRESVCVCV